MNSAAHDIALKLVDLGIATAFGGNKSWSTHVASEPDSPANTITIYDTAGGEPDTDELNHFRPTFQVRVRGASFEEAYARQEAIKSALITFAGDTATSRFILIVMASDIASLGRDTKGNHRLVANYRARREAKEN